MVAGGEPKTSAPAASSWSSPSDEAVSIAVAAVNGVDYLLTWNCKHLANAALRVQIAALLEDAGYACPVICAPEELMEG